MMIWHRVGAAPAITFLLLLALVPWSCTPAANAASTVKQYTLLSSAHIYEQLVELSQKYPNLCTLTTAQESFQLPTAGTSNDCRFDTGTTGCSNYILTIFDSVAHPPSSPLYSTLPEVFLSGALHGNERVGPSAVLETAAILLAAADCEARLSSDADHACRRELTERDVDDRQRRWLARLVTTRRVVVVPMTNALGYHREDREEDGIDPNRDFPYDVADPRTCMRTITGRTVNELFRTHLFQMSLTYHGGVEVIGYEWGAYPYLDTYPGENVRSPDDLAQVEISGGFSRFAGEFAGTDPYITGTTNELVYAVRGGMEDWAYAGSWDVDKMVQCQPTESGGYPADKTAYDGSQLRAFNMLIEASNQKIPSSYLGTSEKLLEAQFFYQANGHVARNIRLALLAIELVEPYVLIRGVNEDPLDADVVPTLQRTGRACQETKQYSIPDGEGATQIVWAVGGGFTVDHTNIIFAKWEDVPAIIDGAYQPKDDSEIGDLFTVAEGQLGPTRWKKNWENSSPAAPPGWENEAADEPLYYAMIDTSSFRPGDRIAVFATAEVDQSWKSQPDGPVKPAVPPMSHVVNARTNTDWRHESSGKIIQGRTRWYSIPLTLVVTEELTPSPTTVPSEAPTVQCIDSATKILQGKRDRSCKWIGKNQKNVRCRRSGVARHCPKTCGRCEDFRCSDSQQRFRLGKRRKKCGWVGKHEPQVAKRCAKSGVLSTCRDTCGYCTQTVQSDGYDSDGSEDGFVPY